jgi:hypothetical protein
MFDFTLLEQNLVFFFFFIYLFFFYGGNSCENEIYSQNTIPFSLRLYFVGGVIPFSNSYGNEI